MQAPSRPHRAQATGTQPTCAEHQRLVHGASVGVRRVTSRVGNQRQLSGAQHRRQLHLRRGAVAGGGGRARGRGAPAQRRQQAAGRPALKLSRLQGAAADGRTVLSWRIQLQQGQVAAESGGLEGGVPAVVREGRWAG